MSKNKIKSNLGKGIPEKRSASKGDAEEVAAGGEMDQIAAGERPVLTTNQGVAISDNQNSLKANLYGFPTSRHVRSNRIGQFSRNGRSPTSNATDTCRWNNRKAVWRMSQTHCMRILLANHQPKVLNPPE
jgi:hypothetical protein